MDGRRKESCDRLNLGEMKAYGFEMGKERGFHNVFLAALMEKKRCARTWYTN